MSHTKKYLGGALAALLALFAAVVVATPAQATETSFGGLTFQDEANTGGFVDASSAAVEIKLGAGDVDITGTANETNDFVITLDSDYVGTITLNSVDVTAADNTLQFVVEATAGANIVLSGGTEVVTPASGFIGDNPAGPVNVIVSGEDNVITGATEEASATATINVAEQNLTIGGTGSLEVNGGSDNADAGQDAIATTASGDTPPKGVITFQSGVTVEANGGEADTTGGNGIAPGVNLIVESGANVTATGGSSATSGNGVEGPDATFPVTIDGTLTAIGGSNTAACGVGLNLAQKTTIAGSGTLTAIGGGKGGAVKTATTAGDGIAAEANNVTLAITTTATGGDGATAGQGISAKVPVFVTANLTAQGGAGAVAGDGVELTDDGVLSVDEPAVVTATGGAEGTSAANQGDGISIAAATGGVQVLGGSLTATGASNGKANQSGTYGGDGIDVTGATVAVSGGTLTAQGGSAAEPGIGLKSTTATRGLTVENVGAPDWDGPTVTLVGGEDLNANGVAKYAQGATFGAATAVTLYDGVNSENNKQDAIYPWILLGTLPTAQPTGSNGLANTNANSVLSFAGTGATNVWTANWNTTAADSSAIYVIKPAPLDSAGMTYRIAGSNATATPTAPGPLSDGSYNYGIPGATGYVLYGEATFKATDGTTYTMPSTAFALAAGTPQSFTANPSTNATISVMTNGENDTSYGTVNFAKSPAGNATTIDVTLAKPLDNLYGDVANVSTISVPMSYQVTLNAQGGQYQVQQAQTPGKPFVLGDATFWTQPGTGRLLMFDAGTSSYKPNIEDGLLGDLPACTKAGDTFSGWWNAAQGGNPVPVNATYESTQTIYAQYNGNTPAGQIGVKVLYNPYNGDHLFTTSASEEQALEDLGWLDYGIAWNAPLSSNVPVYRIYNPYSHDHYWATSKAELQGLVNIGWRWDNDEQPVFYGSESALYPVYQLFNPYATEGTHYWTTNYNEYVSLQDLGWQRNQVAWYAQSLAS